MRRRVGEAESIQVVCGSLVESSRGSRREVQRAREEERVYIDKEEYLEIEFVP